MIARIQIEFLLQHALAGVGDVLRGEFYEGEERSLHLKRRLTEAEWGDRPWGQDYRHTPEGEARLRSIVATLPAAWHEQVLAELHGDGA